MGDGGEGRNTCTTNKGYTSIILRQILVVKCGLYILEPHLEKEIANVLKIGRVIAIFVRLMKIQRIVENIFFLTLNRCDSVIS